MTRKDRIIGGQLVAFDSETNEIMVKVSGVHVDVEDLDIGNMNPLNVAGEKVNISTEEKQTELNACVGELKDAPVAYNGDDESDISRSGISLWKRMCNSLKAIAATLATVKTNTDPLVTADGGGYIRQDSSATIALESDGNLAAIKAKTDNIPALGQALAATSVPVVLTADQITTLTPPAAITGFATAAAQASLLAAQKPYSTVLAGYLTLSGSAELLIPEWVEGVYTVGSFVQDVSAIYYCILQTTDQEPGISTTAYWYPVTPRAIMISPGESNMAGIYYGSSIRQNRLLEVGCSPDKISLDDIGVMGLYVNGTVSETVEIMILE
jgi:hypothetical protein